MTEKHFHRRNLPHLYFNDGIYFITYRLTDSLPTDKVDEVKAIIVDKKLKDEENFKRLFKKYDKILDSGLYGKTFSKFKDSRNLQAVFAIPGWKRIQADLLLYHA